MDFDLVSILDLTFEFEFDFAVATEIEEIVNVEDEADPLVVFVVDDEVGRIGIRLDSVDRE